jgi:hypothetical protein
LFSQWCGSLIHRIPLRAPGAGDAEEVVVVDAEVGEVVGEVAAGDAGAAAVLGLP